MGSALAATAMALLAACADAGDATPTPTLAATPTPEATPLEDVTPFPGGGIPAGGDLAPEHTVVTTEEGVWYLSPVGGPWDAMAGDLTITEVVDGASTPACTVSLALTGSILEEGACSGCQVTLAVDHRVVSAEGTCSTPDLPVHGELRAEGYQSAQRVILLDYQDTGVWLPWYDANLAGDTLSFSFTATYGYLPEEEEE